MEVVIVAAGKGERFGEPLPKQFYKIDNETILQKSIKKFDNILEIQRIIVVVHNLYLNQLDKFINIKEFNTEIIFVKGGNTRIDSVYNGLKKIKKNTRKILIHDGVRYRVSKKLINNIINELMHEVAVIPKVDISQSIVVKENNMIISKYVDRNKYALIQTPQGFSKDIICEAFKYYYSNNNKNINFYDDGSIVQWYIQENNIDTRIKLIEGEKENIKVTYKSDILN